MSGTPAPSDTSTQRVVTPREPERRRVAALPPSVKKTGIGAGARSSCTALPRRQGEPPPSPGPKIADAPANSCVRRGGSGCGRCRSSSASSASPVDGAADDVLPVLAVADEAAAADEERAAVGVDAAAG